MSKRKGTEARQSGNISASMRWPLWKRNLAVLWMGQFAVTLGLTGTTPFMLFHIERLATGSEGSIMLWTSIALAGPSVTYMLTTPLWGKLGDRVSRKWMFVRALVALGICMLGMAWAPTILVFVIFRLLQGGLGGIYDAAIAMIAVTVPPDRKGEAIGRYQQAVIAGGLTGPLIGGLAMGWIGSNMFLTAAALITLACSVLAWSVLSDPPKSRVNSVLGADQTVNEATDHKNSDEKGTGSKPNGVWASILLFSKHSEMRYLLTAGILSKCAGTALVAIYPLFIREHYTSGPSAANMIGMLEAATGIGALYGAGKWSREGDRKDPVLLILIALCLSGIVVLLQASTPAFAVLIVLKLAQGYVFSAVIPLVLRSILQHSAEGRQGVNIGTANSLLVTGQLAGSFMPQALHIFPGLLLGIGGIGILPLIGAAVVSILPIKKKYTERRIQKRYEHQTRSDVR
ncbi:MFS transporter [Paenibacillus sp. YPG26]|uniref:MFS transporter n=1 Tax=Paenibacillus sp. YPG26 TaxID=2878915 RepID=UPI002040F9A5|nr:MFS transporter [Paenibacillus sp. YPG26]USB31593.1 MFS transporter [Paenibacillus sp. YPG26]